MDQFGYCFKYITKSTPGVDVQNLVRLYSGNSQDRCHTYRAILSRNFIARQNRKRDIASRATSQQSLNSFSDQSSALFCATVSRKSVNADWSILVYTTKLQCATRHVTFAIFATKWRDKIAGVTWV